MTHRKINRADWESLERDSTRGFEILGHETANGWEVEVRFDDNTEPRRPTGRTPTSRDEAIKTGRELATMG